eukprot:CAMPEP_0195508478 /NCGR_PEP_ID=MMETSP0794_2-20130614/1679_1 /TAXON_ID=515487 /ORGANISM="Stephanopyxis turris, Strain CCMP 815" /LENGTH=472 /DNA_ID=CAMNT_0040635451 /DNA_START=266 /DNA_END=1681 /DNA_ORIENTATION=-
MTAEEDRNPEGKSLIKKWFSPGSVSVAAVLASAFLNLLGFTMAGPITPALGQHFGLKVGASFGSLTSAYPLGMLLGLFLWPQLSDRIGRKPVIVASLLGSGLGLAAQSYVIKARLGLMIFLLTRVLTGSFAGSSPVSKAFLADKGAAEGKLPRYLALRDAASTMAFIVGPLLGGVFFDVRRRAIGVASDAVVSGGASTIQTTGSLAFVIGISAAASLVAAALVAFGVTEAPPRNAKTTETDNAAVVPEATTESTANAVKAAAEKKEEILSCPLGNQILAGVASVCVISFLFNVGDSTFHAFFAAIMKDRVGLDTREIGLSYTIFACLSFTVSATMSSRCVRELGPVPTCIAGLSACGAGLLALAKLSTMAQPSRMALGAAGLYYCGVPLYGPTIPTMLLRCVPPNRRGAVMGLDGAINTVARVVSPLVMGILYQRFGPGTTFGISGIVVFMSALVCFFRRLAVLRKRDAPGA